MPYLKNSELMPFLLFFDKYMQLNPWAKDDTIIYQLDRHKLTVGDFKTLKGQELEYTDNIKITDRRKRK